MAGVVFSGITQIAGEPDTGKTMFAWSTGASPEDTVFIDDDVKGASIVAQIEDQGHKIGHYVNLMERGRDMKEIQFHMLGLTIIKEIEEKVAKERAGKRFEVLGAVREYFLAVGCLKATGIQTVLVAKR
jgi:hypothetical protein